MNDVRTVDQLELALKTAEPEPLQPARLSEIRTRGRRRQRGRLAAVAAGTAAAVVAASVGVAALTGGLGDRAEDAPPVAHEPPRELSVLAKRVLAEIPGAQQVSGWQVVVPVPVGAKDSYPDQRVATDRVAAGPFDVGARNYTGVTAFRPSDFPAWLFDGVSDYEQHVTGTPREHSVGSTDMGILVDSGQLRLACVETKGAGDDCYPAMLSGADGDLAYRWGMGTEDFLQDGSDLELFHTSTYTSGAPQTVWIGGADGTDVASVDLVTTDGETVSAHVEAGTFVPGETMFWGTVDGELAKAVTRDADGDVLEEHEVKPCSDPVDCEVR